MKVSSFLKISKPIVLVLLISCFYLFNSDCFSQSQDKWIPDTSWMDTEQDYTLIYISLGLLAALTISYFIFNSSSAKDTPTKIKKEPKTNKNTKSDSTNIEKPDSTSIKKQNNNDK